MNYKDEYEKLLAAITEHHAQKADDRCIFDDDKLYEAAGLPPCDRRVGSKEDMLKNCARFIERRCQEGHWPTYKQLEEKIAELEKLLEQEKIWKEEDPRMLREQIRVADAAYNYLHGKHAKAQKEIARFEQWVKDCQSGMYINCVYCGHRYGPADQTAEWGTNLLKEHIKVCPEHPMSKIVIEIKNIVTDLRDDGHYNQSATMLHLADRLERLYES